jgi:hypothetical protein
VAPSAGRSLPRPRSRDQTLGTGALAVVVAWLLISRAWRAAGITTGASVVAFAAIVVPFAAVDPHPMFDLVIRAQLGRGRGGTHELDRLARMFNVDASSIAASPRLMAGAGLLALKRPGISGDWFRWKIHVMGRPWSYPPEYRDRAVRLVLETKADYGSEFRSVTWVGGGSFGVRVSLPSS